MSCPEEYNAGEFLAICELPYEPVDHRLFGLEASMLYGADLLLGLGDGEARPRLCALTCSGRLCGVRRGDGTGESCVDDMSDVRFEVGG